MKASELIKLLEASLANLGDREVVVHDGDIAAVEKGLRQFQVITYGDDAAQDDKNMPFEIWSHASKEAI